MIYRYRGMTEIFERTYFTNLCTLYRRVCRSSIEVVQVLKLNEVIACFVYVLKQCDDLQMVDYIASMRCHETAAPLIRTERLGQALRPHLRATVRNHLQLEAMTAQLLKALAQFLGTSAMPIQEDIYPHQILLLGRRGCAHLFIGNKCRR